MLRRGFCHVLLIVIVVFPDCISGRPDVLGSTSLWVGGCEILSDGSKKGGSFEPPIVGWVCPVVGHLNPTKSCAIKPFIAQLTGVGNNLVEVLSGVVRLALIAGVG